MLKKCNVPIHINHIEKDFFKINNTNIYPNKDLDELNIGSIVLKLIHTPGHTPGSQCIFSDNILISGDTLFIDACGRCDLPGSNAKDMYYSLNKKLAKLPNNTHVFPGHNYHQLKYSTIAQEKKSNPYFQIDNVSDFITRKAWGDNN